MTNGFIGRPRGHRAARPREQDLQRHAARLLVQERLVGGVLQQPPHEVGHARHEVPDRAVGAHAQAQRRDRGLQRIAEPAQDLELEVGVRAAGEPVVGDRVRDRAQVVRGDRDPDLRPRVQEPAREQLEVRIGVGLDVEHRRRPAVLRGLDELVVPVGALDQPDRQRLRALDTVEPGQDRVQRVRRVAQVALQHQAGGRAGAELVLAQELEDQFEHRVARVHRLHVDVQVRPEILRPPQQRPQAIGGVALAALGRVGPQQRGQRGHLHGQVRARQHARRIALELLPRGPGRRRARDRVQRVRAARRRNAAPRPA